MEISVKVTEEEANVLRMSLDQEARSLPSKRVKAKVCSEGDKLRVLIEASDEVALRAAVNSFIRWIDACIRCMEAVD